MLSSASYFQALDVLGNAQTTEWHATVAGLVTIRFVDDWLDFGPYAREQHQEHFRNVRSLIASVPRAYALQTLLGRIVWAVEQADRVTTQIVAAPILAYTDSLECDGKFTLAHSVLLPLRMRAEHTDDLQTTIRVSLRLGFLLRVLGQWDLAIDNYRRASYYARKIGDTPAALQGTVGEAKTIAAIGDWDHGYKIIANVVLQAEDLVDNELLGNTLHDLASLVSMRGEHKTAIPIYDRAIKHINFGIRQKERVVADLISTRIVAGDFPATARKLAIKLALTARERLIRWQATNCLMAISAVEHQAENFERYRSAMELAPLNPWTMVGYRRCAAHCYHLLGNESRAQEEYQKSREVAERHGIHLSYAG